MRRCFSSVLIALAVSVPAQAWAQGDCPPGSWFCEEVEVAPPPEAPPAAPAGEPPADAPSEPAPAPPAGAGAAEKGTPPVIVYQPVPDAPPPQVVIVQPGTAVRTVPPPPPPPKKRAWKERFGLNLRLQGVVLGGHEDVNAEAGMGGLGVSFRYRPAPAFALDFGADLVAGIDYNGFDRVETPLSLSGLLYVNPKSKVQFYFMGGINGSYAHVESDTYSPLLAEEGGYQEDYSYFGGHGGLGLEFRLSRRVALNIDTLVAIRGRTDNGNVPEFRDADSGRTTNTSGAGMFRGGVTFWW